MAIASSLFASYVVETSNVKVLVDSPHCGAVNLSLLYDTHTGRSTHYSKLIPAVKAYADECYAKADHLPTRCHNTFALPTIQVTDGDATCPWQSALCPSGDRSALELDSGFIDQSTLGFNVRPDDGVKFRKKTVCSVLPVEGYMSTSSASGFSNALRRKTLLGEPVQWLHYYANQSKPTFSQSMLTSYVTGSYSTK